MARTSASKRKPTDASAPSKTEAIVALLRRKGGASIEEMAKATGWRTHSVRGFLSGTIRKKLKLALSSAKPEGGVRRYHVKRAR